MYRRTPTASQSQTKNSLDTGVIPSFVSLSHIIVLKCLRFSQARCISSSFTFHFPHCTLTRYLVFAQANLIPLSLKRGKSKNSKFHKSKFKGLSGWVLSHDIHVGIQCDGFKCSGKVFQTLHTN